MISLPHLSHCTKFFVYFFISNIYQLPSVPYMESLAKIFISITEGIIEKITVATMSL